MSDGAYTIADERNPTIEVVCDVCGRSETVKTADMREKYGADYRMPDLIQKIVSDCPRGKTVSVYDRCRAYYADPIGKR